METANKKMNNTNKDNKQDKQPTLRPKMGGTNPKRPFNPYWIYAVALAILMGMWFFGQDRNGKRGQVVRFSAICT